MRFLPLALVALLSLPLAAASGLARTVEDACEPSSEWEQHEEAAVVLLPPSPPSPPPMPGEEGLPPTDP